MLRNVHKLNKILLQLVNNTNWTWRSNVTCKGWLLKIGGAIFLCAWMDENWKMKREKKARGDRKGVSLCPLQHPRSTLFSLQPKLIISARRARAILARAGSDRQLLLNPDCFRFTGCERVWLRGCDPSEGGLSPPSVPPPQLLSVSGRWGRWGVSGGGGVVHHVTHVSCWAD